MKRADCAPCKQYVYLLNLVSNSAFTSREKSLVGCSLLHFCPPMSKFSFHCSLINKTWLILLFVCNLIQPSHCCVLTSISFCRSTTHSTDFCIIQNCRMMVEVQQIFLYWSFVSTLMYSPMNSKNLNLFCQKFVLLLNVQKSSRSQGSFAVTSFPCLIVIYDYTIQYIVHDCCACICCCTAYCFT